VLEEVIRQQKDWLDAGYDIKPVAVNFSAAQLQDHGFIDFLKVKLFEHGLKPDYIELEITENVFVEELSMTSAFLSRIHDMGIHISIDDFGTGYSSLNYLISLPISKIKLDRSLSEKYLAPGRMNTIVSLINLSHSLNLQVVAEGIEAADDVIRLLNADCDTIQGYYFSQPLSVSDVKVTFGKDYLDMIQ